MWGLRLRSLLRRLRYLASVDCGSSGQVVSQDDVLPAFSWSKTWKVDKLTSEISSSWRVTAVFAVRVSPADQRPLRTYRSPATAPQQLPIPLTLSSDPYASNFFASNFACHATWWRASQSQTPSQDTLTQRHGRLIGTRGSRVE